MLYILGIFPFSRTGRIASLCGRLINAHGCCHESWKLCTMRKNIIAGTRRQCCMSISIFLLISREQTSSKGTSAIKA